MSPKFSALMLPFVAFGCPLAVSVTEGLAAEPGILEQAAPNLTGDRVTREDTAQTRAVVLPKKDSTVDLSRLPRPLTFGPIVVGAFHIFPGQEPGRYIGPPTKIFGLGFGTSLWRNRITGWPEM